MENPVSSTYLPRNQLLSAMPAESLARLRPRLERVELGLRQVIQPSNEPIAAVYFPESGWASMMALLADGNSAEVGIVGFEGLVGLPILFGTDQSPTEAMIQAPGTFLRLSADAFREEIERTLACRLLMLRYAQAFHVQVTQTAACNGHHALSQRLARWLLIAHDRAESDEVPVTQEFLAMMLCAHRPSVTVAARLFQQAGLIRYSSGRVTVTNRPGLEAASCECHGAVYREFERLLGAVKQR